MGTVKLTKITTPSGEVTVDGNMSVTGSLIVTGTLHARTTDFIVSELDAAITFFTGATNTGSSRGSLISSYALKGRVLLYEGNYSESAIASRKALDIKSALD